MPFHRRGAEIAEAPQRIVETSAFPRRALRLCGEQESPQSPSVFLLRSSFHSLQQMISDSQRVRHNRQSRIYRRARHEEAAVNHIEVVQVVRLAVHVQRRGLRVTSEADRAVLVRDSGKRDALAKIEAARK